MEAIKVNLPRLNIGCGRNIMPKEEGWINSDLYAGNGVDIVFDAQGEWPFENESINFVRCHHTLEHLSNPLGFFKESWRVLTKNGRMDILVPHAYHKSAWWDLTHVRAWFPEAFAILQPGFTYFSRNLQQDKMGFAFWITECVMILENPWARMWRFKPLRPVVKWAGGKFLGVYRNILVNAVKTTEDDKRSVAFGGPFHPAIVPCQWGVMEHDYYKITNPTILKLIVFGSTKNDRNIAGYV